MGLPGTTVNVQSMVYGNMGDCQGFAIPSIPEPATLSLLALGGAMVLQPAMAQDGEALFKSKPCAACHQMEAKVVGPSLKQVAEKYEDNEENIAMLADHIKNGHVGTWGQIPMPANPVTEEEAKE